MIVPRRGDGAVVDVNGIADPREVGDLLQAWLNIQMEAVDDLVAEARDKVDAIPRWKTIAQLVGELVVRVYALEQDIEDLKRSRR